MLNDEYQSMAANAVAHEARMAGNAIREVAYSYDAPSVKYRPSLSIDGNKWCALYGENLQDGLAGLGDSPNEAMQDFDRKWFSSPASGGAEHDD